MARPQEFETSEALRKAMRVFWSKGYETATLDDILVATGLSKSSLYATFGDKRELFLAAFAAYRRERLQHLEAVLNNGQPAYQAIEEFFRQGVAHVNSPEHAYGCMTANEAVELAPHDVDIQRLVEEDFQVHPLSVVYNSKTRQMACFSYKPARNLAEISPESQAEHPIFTMLPPFSIRITVKDRVAVPLPSIFDQSVQPA